MNGQGLVDSVEGFCYNGKLWNWGSSRRLSVKGCFLKLGNRKVCLSMGGNDPAGGSVWEFVQERAVAAGARPSRPAMGAGAAGLWVLPGCSS